MAIADEDRCTEREAELERKDRLDIARTLYKSLVAQYPDKLITLCDDRARVLVHCERLLSSNH